MNVHLGAALKEARDNRGVEQHELAQLLGVSDTTVSKLEHGRRPLRATEFLLLGLLFPNWFEMQANDLVIDLKAELSARLREFLGQQDFAPTEFSKRDWLEKRLLTLEDNQE